MPKLSWNKIEKSISDEIEFLRNNLSPSPYNQNEPIKCNDCILRLIAVLVVSGKVKVNKIKINPAKIWGDQNLEEQYNNFKKHGTAWHDGLIETINGYFLKNSFKTVREPNLFFGKADLGVNELNLFFEIGTVSLYKLYVNLLNIANAKIILMPYNEYLVEFIV